MFFFYNNLTVVSVMIYQPKWEDSCSYFPRMQYKSLSFLPLVAKLVRPILAEIERSRSWTSYLVIKITKLHTINSQNCQHGRQPLSFCQYSCESRAHLLGCYYINFLRQLFFSPTVPNISLFFLSLILFSSLLKYTFFPPIFSSFPFK